MPGDVKPDPLWGRNMPASNLEAEPKGAIPLASDPPLPSRPDPGITERAPNKRVWPRWQWCVVWPKLYTDGAVLMSRHRTLSKAKRRASVLPTRTEVWGRDRWEAMQRRGHDQYGDPVVRP